MGQLCAALDGGSDDAGLSEDATEALYTTAAEQASVTA